jgi:hypothetical protein
VLRNLSQGRKGGSVEDVFSGLSLAFYVPSDRIPVLELR